MAGKHGPQARRKEGKQLRRRKRRSRKLSFTFHQGPPLGPGVIQASLEEVLAAVEAHADLDWPDVREVIVPVMPRVRPFPDGAPEPLQTLVEPGVVVGFGVDVGPAFLGVSKELAKRWQVTTADLLASALANVHARAALVDPSIIVHGGLDAMPVDYLQTEQSIGSVLVLAPGELRRLFGPGPRLFITPMRDLIIGLPSEGSRDLALWLYLEIAAGDPNCLGPTAYRFDGNRVTPESLDWWDVPLDSAPPDKPFLAA